MVNNSYICGAERNIDCTTNTDLGGVSWLHIGSTDVFRFCKKQGGASLSLYILTN